MMFNVDKCKVMHVGHNNPCYPYQMGGVVLQTTEEEKDIGVTVSKNLKPGAQCRRAARTAQTVLAQVSRSFHFRDRHVFVRLYTTYVRPHLEFSSPAWSPHTEADKACLEKVQRKAVGMVSGLNSNVYEDRLVELGLDTLEERRVQLDLAQTFKIVKGVDKMNKSTWFEMTCERERQTRANDDPLNLRIPAPRTEMRRAFFSQRIPCIWNQVPSSIKDSRTVGQFKKALRAHRRAPRAATRDVTG